MALQFGLIVLLILLNGAFSMSEMAIVSARKARLRQLADAGGRGASKALELAEQPTRFLSTIQVGITSIGILSGALGEDAIAKPLLPHLHRIPQLEPYAEELALAVTVAVITYLSLIAGELVPKRVALNSPERIAALVARPMHGLSLAALPVVQLLMSSTELAVWLLGIRPKNEPSVTEEEIKILLDQGTEEGVFEEAEQKFMENILRLDDRRVGGIMVPRKDIVWLDVQLPFEENRRRILDRSHRILPLCDGGLDRVVGLVKTKDLLDRALLGERPDIRAVAVEAPFVPESLTLMELLEEFRGSRLHTALVMDEYGEIDGLVTLGDILEAIVGYLPARRRQDRPSVVQRKDGSWLVDGMLDIDRFKEHFELDELPGDGESHFNTVGGFVMAHLGHVPKATDSFEFSGLLLEVVDMDGKRVDKVLISQVADHSPVP